MNQKKYVLSIVVIVVAFIFLVGAIAIYASTTQASYNRKDSYASRQASSYTQPTVVNNYYQQQPVQAAPGTNCNQQVTGYYNNQPQVDCVPSGSTPGSYSSQQGIKIYVQTSGNYGGYYPYPSYYSRYYSYPKYYPYPYPHYPQHPSPPYYPKYPYSPQKPWW